MQAVPDNRSRSLLNAECDRSAPTSSSTQAVVDQIAGDNASFLVREDFKKRRHGFLPDFSQGSTWGTTFNMCSAILGAGALSLPHAVHNMGVVSAVVLLVLTAFATHYSVVLLIDALGASGAKSFEDLTLVVFGKVNGRLVELSIIVFQLGTLIAYTVAIGDILEPLTRLPAIEQAVPWLKREYIIIFFWAVIMLPLSFVEKISALQFTSLFGVLSLIYLVCAVAIHAVRDSILDPSGTVGDVRYYVLDQGAVSAAAIVMFAFTCQVNVPSLYDELNERTPAEMRRVSARAVALCLACYLTVGFTGYVDFPRSTQGNLLNNYCLLEPPVTAAPAAPGPGGAAGAPVPRVITAAFGAIAVTITMAYPVNVFPTRYTIDLYFQKCLGDTYRRTRHVGLTLCITVVTLLLALLLHDISTVFSLMGGTASAYVCYIIPACAAWKLRADIPRVGGSLSGKLACLGLIAFGVLVGVLSTATTIAGLFAEAPAPPPACNTTWHGTHAARGNASLLLAEGGGAAWPPRATFGEPNGWPWL